MSRTVAEIFNHIITVKEATPELSGLSSTSKVSVWRAWAYVMAVCIWLHEQIFESHKKEVQSIIDNQEPHHAAWYGNIAKDFQFGYSLPVGKVKYDNTGLDGSVVSASKVVYNAAAIEIPKGILIKVSGLSGGDLSPLSTTQFNSFKTYMGRVKDLGVKISFKNLPADALKLHLKIYYDPLVLAADGKRLDGTNDTPCQQAIREYLKNDIDFNNGYYINAKLIDTLQKVDGVKVPHLVLAQSKYGALPFTDIVVKRIPDAGWMRIADADLTLEFIPYELL